MKHMLLLFCCGLILLTGLMCSRDKDANDNVYSQLTIQAVFDGPLYQGDFYQGFLPPTEYALWIEDESGNYIKTIEVTPTAVTVDSSQAAHLDHLAFWAEAAGITSAGLAATISDGIAPAYDGVTGASRAIYQNPGTPATLEKSWDLTNEAGQLVSSGIYYVCFEAANIVKNADKIVTILSETTRCQVNSKTWKTIDAAATTHILQLTADFTKDNSKLSKSTLLGTN